MAVLDSTLAIRATKFSALTHISYKRNRMCFEYLRAVEDLELGSIDVRGVSFSVKLFGVE